MKQLGFQPELEVWTVWTRSGRSGHGLRCLEPGQKFRKFNPDHFTFFKNLYRTSASRVSLPWLEIGSGRSGNGLRCLEPGQKFRIFNSDHFTFLKNFNPTSGSRVSIKSHKKLISGMCAQQFCEAGNWVWTVWKRCEVSGTRPEVSEIQF